MNFLLSINWYFSWKNETQNLLLVFFLQSGGFEDRQQQLEKTESVRNVKLKIEFFTIKQIIMIFSCKKLTRNEIFQSPRTAASA